MGSSAAAEWEPAPHLVRALAPLLVDPSTTAVITDFDGTLAPIVADPYSARPSDAAVDVLVSLSAAFGVVAVVSGRPVAFLEERLVVSGLDRRSRPIRFVGLYGLEWSWGDGRVTAAPEAERWRPVVADATERFRAAAPPGVLVEPKGLTVTLHWRAAPDAEEWVRIQVAAEEDRSGLRAHPGRLSTELRPPLAVDKGSVVRQVVVGCGAACFLGDDIGDLPAFAALRSLAADSGIAAVSIAVVDAESAEEVAEAADVQLSGPDEAVRVLRWLARSAGEPD